MQHEREREGEAVIFDHEAAEHQERRVASQRLVAALRQGRISRRDFVVRAAALGFTGATINLFLAACRSGSVSPTIASTTATATSSVAPNTSAAPGVGATPSASGPRPGGGTATRPAASSVAATATRAASPTAATPSSAPPSAIPNPQGTMLGGEPPPGAQLADRQELRYPFVELVHADPGQATSLLEVQFIRNCWDGLITANQQGEPKPAHATKYDISADGLTYTFTLRSDLKFSDGSPLRARDYEWTWKRNLSPDTASEYAPALYPIKGAQDYNTGKSTDPNSVQVRATNDTTLVVTLAAPAAYFLTLVSTWIFVPLQQATIEKNQEKWVEADNLVSAGQYKLQEWAHDQRMVLVADPNYYGEKPSVQQITLVLYQDIAAASLPAYEKGEIDVVNNLSPENWQRAKNDGTLGKELYQLPSSGTGFIVFDVTNAASPVAKREFRQAVHYALNRDSLCANVLNGRYLPKTTLVPKGILGYQEQLPLPVAAKGDKPKARQLLQAAGYGGQELVFTHTDTATARVIAQAIQADLKEVGIAIRLEQLDRRAYSTWRAARQDQPFDLYIGGWFSDYEDPHNWYNVFFGDVEEYWHTHYPQVESGKALVELIRSMNSVRDRAQRQAGYEQAETQLLTDLPLVPIYNTTDVVLVKPYVKGLVHTNIGQDLFGGVRILKR